MPTSPFSQQLTHRADVGIGPYEGKMKNFHSKMQKSC